MNLSSRRMRLTGMAADNGHIDALELAKRYTMRVTVCNVKKFKWRMKLATFVFWIAASICPARVEVTSEDG